MDELVKNILIKLEDIKYTWRYFWLFVIISIIFFVLSFYFVLVIGKDEFASALIGNAMFMIGVTFVLWLLIMAEKGKRIIDDDRVSQIIDALQSETNQEGFTLYKKGKYSDYKNIVSIDHKKKTISIGLHIDPKTKGIKNIYIYIEDANLKSKIAQLVKDKGYTQIDDKRDLIFKEHQKIGEKDNKEIVEEIMKCIRIISEVK